MKPKIILSLALVLIFALTGCASAKFKVVSDKQRLTETHRVVAQVTCLEATPKHYTTFRDRYFRMLAMPPRTRWCATFKVNQVIKGSFSEPTFTLTDAKDAQATFSRFYFEAGQDYTVGFERTPHHAVKYLAVCYQDDLTSWPDRETSGLPWPRPRESIKVIERRFAHAPLKDLGTESDFAAIRELIIADRPRLNLRIEQLRWLSPVLVIAKVRATESEYFYVVEKKNGQWTILNYYLEWIS